MGACQRTWCFGHGSQNDGNPQSSSQRGSANQKTQGQGDGRGGGGKGAIAFPCQRQDAAPGPETSPGLEIDVTPVLASTHASKGSDGYDQEARCRERGGPRDASDTADAEPQERGRGEGGRDLALPTSRSLPSYPYRH